MHKGSLARLAAAGLLLTTSALMAMPVAVQESAESSFKSKTVRIVVGYGPGGGYDVYARMIAPYLAKALEATVIVGNSARCRRTDGAEPCLGRASGRAHDDDR